MASRHRFKPRYRGVALTSLGAGGILGIAGFASLGALPIAMGLVGVVLGAGYILSPSWRLEVITDDDGLEVKGKFRIAWGDIVKVISAPTDHTMFIDGGVPEHSLLVPGDGAPAPYDLEDKPGLCAAVLAHVPADKVETVETLAAKA